MTVPSNRQGGQALLILAALLVLGGTWALVGAVNSLRSESDQRAYNARRLAEVKTALIGWVAATAANSTENNPGRLPCPQAWSDVGSTNEGRAAGNCSATAAGWVPWRTLGIDKPLDVAGRQFWYVVSPGWHLPSAGATLTINSNTAGQLSLDGTPVVALLIAPGPALKIAPNSNQTAAGCTSRTQVQTINLPGTSPNPLDFLDCQNGTTSDNTFTTAVVDNATNPVFNDQVVAITTADLLPALEAAIARRMATDIVPVLKSVYADTAWGTSSASPAFAFPAPFADPTTSNYRGQNGLYQGLLPFNYHSASCGSDVRCSSNAITWSTPTLSTSGGPGYLPSAANCGVSGATPSCDGFYYGGALTIAMTNAAADITQGLRTFTVSDHTATGWSWSWNGSSWAGPFALTATTSRNLASSGAANFVASAALPSVSTWGYYYIEQTRPAISDHSILSSTTSGTGWFVRNEWYRLVYYAIASPHAPGGTLACSDSGSITCLQVAGLTDPTKQRAILVLAGRALSGQTRPQSALQHYLDSAENQNTDPIFEQLAINRSFNDRFVSVSKNP